MAKKNSGRKVRRTIWIVAILALLVGMFMTCPDKAKHQEALSDTVHKALKSGAAEGETGLDKAMGQLGSIIAGSISDAYISGSLTVDNYYLFSVGKMPVDGEDTAVSLGILNHVFTKPADKLK